MALPPSAPLRGLPAELRLNIIEYLFAENNLSVQFHLDTSTQSWTKSLRGALALLHTCRLLRHEALPLRPSISNYTLRFDDISPENAQTWARAVGIDNLNEIKRLEICVYGTCNISPATPCPRRLIVENPAIRSERVYQDITLEYWMDRDTHTLLSALDREYPGRGLADFFCCEQRSKQCGLATVGNLFSPLGGLFLNGTRRALTEEVLVDIVEALWTGDTMSSHEAWDDMF